jgi:uncharacterized RDD family membrane protein YckC
MQLYVERDGQRSRPMTLEEVNRQLAAGMLQPSDLAWSESSPGWKPLLSFTGVMMPGAASSSAMPVALATPISFGSVSYGGFWVRLLALALDGAVLAIAAALLWWLMPRLGLASLFLVTLLALESVYFAAFWSSRMEATPGQKICGLRVIDAVTADGISFSRGLLRVLGMFVSALVLGVGFVMVAFTQRKRGLHDIIAGTYIVQGE